MMDAFFILRKIFINTFRLKAYKLSDYADPENREIKYYSQILMALAFVIRIIFELKRTHFKYFGTSLEAPLWNHFQGTILIVNI